MEQSVLHFLNEVVFAAAEGWIFSFAYMIITNQDICKKNIYQMIIFSFFYILISYLTVLYLPSGFRAVAGVVGLVLLYYFIFRANIFFAIITSLIGSIIIAICEVIIALLLLTIFHLNIEIAVKDPDMKLALNITLKASQILLLLAMYKYRNKFSKLTIIKNPSYIKYTILQIFLVILLIISLNNILMNGKYIILYSFFIIASFLIFIILSMFDLKSKERLLLAQQKTEYQKEYIHSLEEVLELIRKEKHEFANHIGVISVMCLNAKAETLAKIREYTSSISNMQNSGISFYHSGFTCIDALLALKSSQAARKNIIMDVHFETELSKLCIDPVELTSVLGNILDNAMDAVSSRGQEFKGIIALYAYEEEGYMFLSISNNGIPISIENTGRIFDERYSTKNDKGHNVRGYGLYIVKQLLEKNNADIYVTSNENTTEFLLRFPLKDATSLNVSA